MRSFFSSSALWQKLFSAPALLFAVAFALYFRNGTLGGLSEDNGLYIYWGQQLLAGILPYDSAFDHKGPAAGFITGLFIVIGRLLGNPDDVKSAITGFMVVNAAIAASIYVITCTLTRSKAAAMIASGIFLMCYPLAVETSMSPEPKVLCILFSLLMVICIARERWLAMGMLGMLCALTWQPSALASIAIFAFLLRYKYPIWVYAKLLLGLAIPLAACILCYGFAGKLQLLFDGLIGFNLLDLEKPPFAPLDNMQNAYNKLFWWYPYYNWLCILVGCGFILLNPLLGNRGRMHEDKTAQHYLTAIRYMLCLLVAWTIFDMGYRRLLMFAPYGGIGCALAVCTLLQLHRKTYSVFCGPRAALAAAALAIAAIGYTQAPIAENRRLLMQQEFAKKIREATKDTQDILSCRALPYLVLSGTSDSYNRYNVKFKHPGIVSYIDRSHPGGREGILRDIVQRRPELILMVDKNSCDFIQEDNREFWDTWLRANYNRHFIGFSTPSYNKDFNCIACWPYGGLLYYTRRN